MGSMMALRAHARGGPEQLVYEQAPAPSAGPGEVLIAVHAAAITFAELTWDLEWTTRDGQDRTPVIPSHEMSGIIVGLGADEAVRAEVPYEVGVRAAAGGGDEAAEDRRELDGEYADSASPSLDEHLLAGLQDRMVR